MKKILCLAFLIATLGVAFQTGAVSQSGATADSPIQTPTQTTAVETQPLAPFLTEKLMPTASSTVVAATLPSCWNYDGNSCPVQGAKLRCQWQQFEPGMCFCGSNNVWWCG